MNSSCLNQQVGVLHPVRTHVDWCLCDVPLLSPLSLRPQESVTLVPSLFPALTVSRVTVITGCQVNC